MITKKDFGKTSAGRSAALFTLTNSNGMEVDVTDFGATLVAIRVPACDGTKKDVLVGLSNAKEYEEGGFFLGATIGRSGNRIGGASFTLEGETYTLDANEGPNNLHSGNNGYDSRIWDSSFDPEGNAVTFSLFSPDLDQGYPGNFNISVTVSLTEENGVSLAYEGTTDKTTIANLTNHSYFNLSGDPSKSIMSHLLTINADGYTIVDHMSIPTGEIGAVEGTPFDFRTAKVIGKDLDLSFEQLGFTGGYDHNFALNQADGSMRTIAEVTCEETGISMIVTSDLPGVQFYAGNFLTETTDKNGVVFTKHGALCLETQYYPDAIHHASFAQPVLKPGEVYKTTTVYTFCAK